MSPSEHDIQDYVPAYHVIEPPHCTLDLRHFMVPLIGREIIG